VLKLTLATPAYRRQVDVEHVVQGMALQAACRADPRFQLHGFSHADSYSLDWARNRLLLGAIQTGSDWLLFVDADTYHRDAGETLRMIGDGDRLGAAVIAAPVRMRGRLALFNVRERRGDDYFPVEHAAIAGQVREVDAVGTAFMAIRCAWLREHWPAQPWFVTTQLPGPEPRLLSEDLGFCRGVRERGGRVFVDGRFTPTHVGAEAGAEPGAIVEART